MKFIYDIDLKDKLNFIVLILNVYLFRLFISFGFYNIKTFL